MSNIYVNQNEYNFLVNLIEEAMLTCGEIDADSYDCAESLLKKLGYPEVYRNDIQSRLERGEFLYKERCKVPSHKNFNEQKIRNDAIDDVIKILTGYESYKHISGRIISPVNPTVTVSLVKQDIEKLRKKGDLE